jgi:hypothetical protein
LITASRKLGFRPTLVGILVGVAAAFGPATAMAETPTTTSSCPTGVFTQPFLVVGDSNWYSLMHGQTVDNFDGTGWTLRGGATIAQTTLPNGKAADVLDLPSGSKAVSPTTCVTQYYPRARMMVRNLKGSEGVFFYVSYLGTSTWDKPKNTGQVHGSGTAWTAADPVNLQPYKVAGYQTVRFTFKPGGNSSRFQLYNVYVDPRMK